MLAKCPKVLRPTFAAALDPTAQPPVGIILSERYVNLPNEVAPWLQKALFSEIRSRMKSRLSIAIQSVQCASAACN